MRKSRRYFKLVVLCGHVGFKRQIEITRYFNAWSTFDAWKSALNMPRTKYKGSKRALSVLSVEEITRQKYLQGKKREKQDPYLKGRVKYHLA